MIVNRDELIKALRLLAEAQEKRTTIPVLAYVLCKISECRLTMISTDLAVTAVVTVPITRKSDFVAEFCLPFQQLFNLISSEIAEEIGLVIHTDSVRLEASVKAKLNLATADSYPSVATALPEMVDVGIVANFTSMFVHGTGKYEIKIETYQDRRYFCAAEKGYTSCLIMEIPKERFPCDCFLPSSFFAILKQFPRDATVEIGNRHGVIVLRVDNQVFQFQQPRSQYPSAYRNFLDQLNVEPKNYVNITKEMLQFVSRAATFNRNREDIRDMVVVADYTGKSIRLFTESELGYMSVSSATGSGGDGSRTVSVQLAHLGSVIEKFAPGDTMVINDSLMMLVSERMSALVAIKRNSTMEQHAHEYFTQEGIKAASEAGLPLLAAI